MKPKIIAIYLILFLLFSIQHSAFSIQNDSLIYYLEIAAKNNPKLKLKYLEYTAALEKVPQVGSLPDPQLSFGYFIKPMELVMGKQVGSVQLMQMFPWFGTLKASKDEASQMALMKFNEFNDAKLELFFDVQKSWYKLYSIRKNIDIAEKNIDILHTLERLALIHFKTSSSGMTPGSNVPSQNNMNMQQNDKDNSQGMKGMTGNNTQQSAISNQQSENMKTGKMNVSGLGLSDIYRIQIEIGDLENSLALLKNQYSTSLAVFNSYLNRPVETQVSLSDTILPEHFEMTKNAVIDSILANNPRLKMIKAEEASYSAMKNKATKMSYPMLGIGLNYMLIEKIPGLEDKNNGMDMFMPMASLSLPIYRKKYKAMKTEATLLKAASEQSYISSSNSLQTEYFEAIQLYDDSQRRIKLYTEQADLVNKTLQLMLKSFEVSGADLDGILRVNQQTLDYEYKKIEAITDYNISIAWLNRLMAKQ